MLLAYAYGALLAALPAPGPAVYLGKASACQPPASGWYQVQYQRLAGTCGALPSHKQHFSWFDPAACEMPVKISKRFAIYDAIFDGKLTWDTAGKQLAGVGTIHITNTWTKSSCEGLYRLTFQESD